MHSPGRGNWPAYPSRAARRILSVALIAFPLLALLAPKQAHAYAWMIKRSYPSCPACHADPSGGELLTGYGRVISVATLSSNWAGGWEMARSEQGAAPQLALRSPESFAAGSKAAGPKKVDKSAGDAAKSKDAAVSGAKSKDKDASAGAAKSKDKDAAASKDKDAAAGAAKSKEEKAASDEDDDAKDGESDDEDSDEDSDSEETSAGASQGGGGGSEDPTFQNFLFGAFTLPDWLLLGGSYRHLNILPLGDGKFRTFPMMMDLYGQATFGSFRIGGSIGGARVAAGSPYARRAQVTANQGKEWNLISRTHYIGYNVTPEVTLRAGRLNLPFGVRIPEHTMWVRQATNTDRESSQQHGVAAAYAGESLRGEIMAILGNYQMNPDKYRDRGYSGYVEYATSETAAVGISSLYTLTGIDRADNSNLKTAHQVHGLMGRAGFGDRIAVLAEADGIFTSRRDPGYVGFVQLDTEPLSGVHVMLTGEVLDEGYITPVPGVASAARTAGQGKPKFGGWLSAVWFAYSHFDVRIDAIKRTAEDVSLLGQLHVYL